MSHQRKAYSVSDQKCIKLFQEPPLHEYKDLRTIWSISLRNWPRGFISLLDERMPEWSGRMRFQERSDVLKVKRIPLLKSRQ